MLIVLLGFIMICKDLINEDLYFLGMICFFLLCIEVNFVFLRDLVFYVLV